MIGAIIGDIAGSKFESSPRFPKRPVKTKKFGMFFEKSRFTDDTVLTCATAETLMTGKYPFFSFPFSTNYKKWGRKYPDRGYGSGFREWLKTPDGTANGSYANGAMMRCAPIAIADYTFDEALDIAKQSVLYTHNSPESIRGVQSIVSAIWMAARGYTKEQIRAHVEENYGHMLNLTLEQVRDIPKTSIRCNVTAPQALICFMESTDFESAIRNAIYIGGDTDTNAAIAGALAEAFYGTHTIPKKFIKKAKQKLTPEIVDLTNKFYASTAWKLDKFVGFQL